MTSRPLVGSRRSLLGALRARSPASRGRRWGAHLCAAGTCLASAALGCSAEPARTWSCVIPAGDAPDFVEELGCAEDFEVLASAPLAGTIPGARSVKTSIDREGGFALSFQNSERYPVHWEFLSEHRSVRQGLPRVAELQQFNAVEYYSPSRRFLLGSLTHYAAPDVWAYEVSPYDTADAAMLELGYRRVVESTFLGDRLFFHATSLNVASVAADMARDVPRIATEELFAGIDYQPLNIAESVGRLRFIRADELEQSYLGFRDIVVLDRVPNDISVAQGIITAEFQTPLSHINVLSQNRGTPNMALRGAMDRPELRALDGQWVHLAVGAAEYSISPVDAATADAWWEEHRPASVQVPGIDEAITELLEVSELVPRDLPGPELLAAIQEATRAFGGKAANYAALSHIEGLPVPRGFAVPVRHYRDFMRENGFDERVRGWLLDPAFASDAALRSQRLAELRDAMEVAPVSPQFEALLLGKIATDYPGVRLRFRSSTNAEDLDGFTGAGLYTSRTGDLNDPRRPVLDAVRRVWASVWSYRAFEERSYRGIDHEAVGMALLVHRSFPDEEANGVALTSNPFDPSGREPAFYVNVQVNEISVVQPEPGVTSEELLYYFDSPSRPMTYLSQSSVLSPGEKVLTPGQVQELGVALDAIRAHFAPVYAPLDGSWWAMDVEFKFDGAPAEAPALFIKQARPYGKR